MKWEELVAQEENRLKKVHPTSDDIPGCFRLLDDFLNCHGLIAQSKSLYRTGEFRNCDYKWEDAKFCFSLKSHSADERYEAWIRRRAEWWAQKRKEGSSEDVWEVRKQPLQNYPEKYDPSKHGDLTI